MKVINVSNNTSVFKLLVTGLTLTLALTATSESWANYPDRLRAGDEPSDAPVSQNDGANWRNQQRQSAQVTQGPRVRASTGRGGTRGKNCEESTVAKRDARDCVLNMSHGMDPQNRCTVYMDHNASAEISFYFKEEFEQLTLSNVPANLRSQFVQEEAPFKAFQVCQNNRSYYLPMVIGKTVRVQCTEGKAYPVREAFYLTEDSLPLGSCEISPSTGQPNARPVPAQRQQ